MTKYMSKKELFAGYEQVKDKADCIILKIHMPGGETETIINPKVAEKMAYIDKVYDDNLIHANSSEIYIEEVFFSLIGEDDTFDFGTALDIIKDGGAVARKGWNGKNQFVYYVPANEYSVCTDIARLVANDKGKVSYNHYMALMTVAGTVSTWVPSVTDCLADDWYEVEPTQIKKGRD